MKRSVLLTLLVVMGMVLSSCAPAAATEAAKEATPAEVQTTAEPQKEAPAADLTKPAEAAPAAKDICPDGTLKLGMIQPLSGAAATQGGRVVAAAKMAVEEINDAGGVLGCKLDVVVEDSQADAAVAVSAAEKLLDQDKVQIIIGAYHSHTTLAVMPLLANANVPMVEVIATSPKLTEENNGWLFRTSSTNDLDAKIVLKACQDTLNFKKWGFLPVNNDWGKSVPAAYEPTVKELGGEVVLNEPLEQGATNYLTQITKIRNSGADTIAATIDVESLSVLAKQVYEAGLTDKYTWISTSGNSIDLFQQLLKDTPEAAEGWKFVSYYTPITMEGGDTEANIAFTKAITAKYPESPADNPAAQGYQAVYIIKQAMEAAGKYDGTAIRDAMKNVKYQGLNGEITFDEKGQASVNVTLQQIKDGKTSLLTCK